MSKGNLFAYLVLLSWPLISMWLYQKKSIQEATLWVLLGGFMFLAVKTEVDVPLVPPLGKHSMPVLSAILGCWLVKRKKIKYFAHQDLLKALVLLLFITPFMTVYFNQSSIIIGGKYLPGLGLRDVLSTLINLLLFISPFFIGKQFFKSYQDQRLMFQALTIAGLIYSLLVLYEIRMSPQLHTSLYGYFPHGFVQQKREGGFRAVVFMGHGLWVAFFVATTLIASTALWKNKEKIKQYSMANISLYFLFILVLCKSKASLIYGLFVFILIKKVSVKMQMRIAMILMITALSYPATSILKLFPHQSVVQLAVDVMGEERAGSLKFRFDNEAILLAHAQERLWFGWGGWGRNLIHDEETGEGLSVTDGRWIIKFGMAGVAGFIAEFGLLAISILRANKALKLLTSKPEQNLLSAHALLVSIIMIDQIPNASLQPWLWLIAGILLGRAENIIETMRRKGNVPI